MLVDVVQLLKSSSCRDIPIIINGDLYTRNAMVNMRRRAGADGVMLARPALYNTSIFRKPSTSLSSSVSTTIKEEKESNNNDTNQKDDTSDANNDNNTPTNKNEEETRYGYNSPLLLPKTQVIQEYLQYANMYQSNPKNVKYVICEMMNNRRTPSSISYLMPQSYPGKQTINNVCKCKTLDQLCKIWDVSTTSSSSSLLNTTKLSSSSSSNLKSNTNGGVNKAEDVIEGDTHRYDDRYFLDPEALKKERDEEEKLLEGGRKKAKLN